MNLTCATNQGQEKKGNVNSDLLQLTMGLHPDKSILSGKYLSRKCISYSELTDHHSLASPT